ncbi:MAG TPA: hypothetical protein VE465_22600 [Streptosporangiaceae bacterium]|nr:hypothetical protein [Streptosporangiaceae bacterium]
MSERNRGRHGRPHGLGGRRGMVAIGVAAAGCGLVVSAIAFGLPGGLVSRSRPVAAPPPVVVSPPAPTPAWTTAPPPDPRALLGATHTMPATCTVSAKLVPSCGAWWGVAPASFTDTPRTQALHDFERKIGRNVDIYHAYHRGNEIFPTKEEIAIAREPGKRRILLLNWKPDYGRSWASVAGGSMDGQIDRLSAHIKATFPEKFFMVIHHEPEEEVRPTPGSGFTAGDFRNMFRRVVTRFRANGVRNVLFTVVYMGFDGWGRQPWFDRLYPGHDVVDWVGMDPYASAKMPDFAHLVNQATKQGRGFPGFYKWSAKMAPDKPLMIAEWGVFSASPHKSAFFRTVAAQFRRYPRVKAMVYFETPRGPFAGIEIDTRVDSSAATLGAFRKLSNNPQFMP